MNKAKEYLDQAYRLDERINSRLLQLAQLKDMATTITSHIKDICVQESHNNHKLEDTIVKIVEQEKEIDNEIDALVELKADVRHVIDKVPNVEQRLLLEERYLCFKSWEEIAADMSYGLRWIYKLHDKALKSVGQILGE